jgi:hypothetical protein
MLDELMHGDRIDDCPGGNYYCGDCPKRDSCGDLDEDEEVEDD